jgi:RNA polymerase sigma-70 factor, ECF subfamily
VLLDMEIETPGRVFLQALAGRASQPGSRLSPFATAPSTPELEAFIARTHSDAERTNQPVHLDIAAYAQHLAGCVAPLVTWGDDPLLTLEQLFLADLHFACAIGHDLPGARDLFFRRYLAAIRGAIESIDRDPSFVDEVRQAVMERLLAAGGDKSRLLQYQGRASLEAWVVVTARREALGLLRADATRRRALARVVDEPLPFPLDPELAFLRERYREAFRAALSAAISGLSLRQRTVIRLQTVGGLTLARIGALLGVDESTVSRWAQGARRAILLETERELGLQLGLQVSELPSLVRLVSSQIDLSVARLLGETPADVAVTDSR